MTTVEILRLVTLALDDLPLTDIQPCFIGLEGKARKDIRVTGCHLTFANGHTISVQWHSGAYSNIGRGHKVGPEGPTFECMAWDATGEYVVLAGTALDEDTQFAFGVQPAAWQTLPEVIQHVRDVASMEAK
jgi:hypothetical protein